MSEQVLGRWRRYDPDPLRLDPFVRFEHECPYCGHLETRYGIAVGERPQPKTHCWNCHRDGSGQVGWTLYRNYESYGDDSDYATWRGSWSGKRILVPTKDLPYESRNQRSTSEIYLDVYVFSRASGPLEDDCEDYDSLLRMRNSYRPPTDWTARVKMGDISVDVFTKPAKCSSLKEVVRMVERLADGGLDGYIDEVRNRFYHRDSVSWAWRAVNENFKDSPEWVPYCTFFRDKYQIHHLDRGKYLHATRNYNGELSYWIYDVDGGGSYSGGGLKITPDLPQPW